MSVIPDYYSSAVVAIGVLSSDEQKHWIGTGFIVRRKEADDKSRSTYYLVSNRHVFSNKKMVILQLNTMGEELHKNYNIPLLNENGEHLFSVHDNNDIDVAAVQIIPHILVEDKSIWGAFDLDDDALTLNQMQKMGIKEGNLVYALGFPMNIVDDIKVPIYRLGCVSRITDAYLLSHKQPFFIVDAQTFPGNSGGPIISRPDYVCSEKESSITKLIGILSGNIQYKDFLFSQQRNEVAMVQCENSGLTIVYPVDRIKEVVEKEYERMSEFNTDKL